MPIFVDELANVGVSTANKYSYFVSPGVYEVCEVRMVSRRYPDEYATHPRRCETLRRLP